ncbi:hypothetical protein ACIA74_39990 [Streptomyces sp. NPDC051658]
MLLLASQNDPAAGGVFLLIWGLASKFRDGPPTKSVDRFRVLG